VAGDDAHVGLLSRFPGAASAECHGDDWVFLTREDGSEATARCPVCAHARVAQALATFIPPRFFKTVELPDPVAQWAKAGMEAQGLYLTGQVGTGKTHTAWTAVGTWCIEAGITPHHGGETYTGMYGPSVIFTRMTDLLDDLRPGDDARQRVRDCQKAKLLIIDDLGAEKASEWTQERLYSVIDHRYANCLPLIVTSNLPPKNLSPQTGERAASRLAEMCTIVLMTGADRRKPAA
jgi:DNA replication protein DnaC